MQKNVNKNSFTLWTDKRAFNYIFFYFNYIIKIIQLFVIRASDFTFHLNFRLRF